jgi:hypothetical protein
MNRAALLLRDCRGALHMDARRVENAVDPSSCFQVKGQFREYVGSSSLANE